MRGENYEGRSECQATLRGGNYEDREGPAALTGGNDDYGSVKSNNSHEEERYRPKKSKVKKNKKPKTTKKSKKSAKSKPSARNEEVDQQINAKPPVRKFKRKAFNSKKTASKPSTQSYMDTHSEGNPRSNSTSCS